MTRMLGGDPEMSQIPKCDPSMLIRYICGGAFQNLCGDTNVPLRIEAAKHITLLASRVGTAETKKSLLKIMQEYAKDEEALVRLNFCMNLGIIVQMLGTDAFVLELGSLIQENANDSKWRVRHSVISSLSAIAKSMGPDRFQQSPYKEILSNAFTDPSQTCRRAAVNQVSAMIRYPDFKEYIISNIFPILSGQFADARNYLHRITPVSVILECAPVMRKDELSRSGIINSILLKGLKDPVVNVRLYSAKIIPRIYKFIDGTVLKSEIQPRLVELQKDTDEDTKYFANKALKVL